MGPSPGDCPSKGMSLSGADPSGEPLGVRFWVEAHPGTEDLLGWVIVQLLFGRIAAGTVTNDGPSAGSGRKELIHLGWDLEGFTVLNVWKNINSVMVQRKNEGPE